MYHYNKKRKIPHLFRQTFGNQNRWEGSMVIELFEPATRNLNRSMENSLFLLQNKCRDLKGLNIKRASKTYVALSVTLRSEDVWLCIGQASLLTL
jgi:hypothetical protein